MTPNSRQFSRRLFLTDSAAGLALAGLGLAGTLGPPSRRSRLKVPAPMLPPVPAVLLTVKGMPGDPDEISVLWTFVINGDPPQIGVSAGKDHVANRLIARHREFVLNVPVADMVVPFDRVDMNSERVADKFRLAGLTRGRALQVDAPTVEEAPIQVECRVFKTVDVPPIRTLYLATAVATTTLEGVCDPGGRLNVSRVPFFGMTAGSGEFYTMGSRVGHIGQTVGRNDIRY
ncbi:MAG: flavin reductase family protein [Acidobacteriota bacterium]